MALDKKALLRKIAKDPETSRNMAIQILQKRGKIPSEIAEALAKQTEFVKLAGDILKYVDPPAAHKSASGASQDKQG